jgi:hypothetical protein
MPALFGTMKAGAACWQAMPFLRSHKAQGFALGLLEFQNSQHWLAPRPKAYASGHPHRNDTAGLINASRVIGPPPDNADALLARPRRAPRKARRGASRVRPRGLVFGLAGNEGM